MFNDADRQLIQRIDASLRLLIHLIRAMRDTERTISMTLDELQTQVTENTTLEGSAITLIQGIAAQLAAAATDPAKVQALADQLHSSAAALSAAIAANTPTPPVV